MHCLLRITLASLAALCAVGASAQQTFPAKPVRIIVPFPPVGAADLLSRTLGQRLSESLGQQFIIDNRAGAGGNIGAELASSAAPDGYTLLMAPVTTYAVGMSAYTKLNWNLEKNLVPISMVANVPHVLVAHPSLPVKNVKDVIALGKARPNQFNFASQGNGTLSHVEQEMLKQLGGFTANHIPYKGSAPALSDLIAGNVQLFFDSIPSSAPHVSAGRLRGIGVASSKRSPAMPDLPAISESLKGFEADNWFGLMAPAKTPAAVIERLNAAVQKAIAAPDIKEKLLAQGGLVHGGTTAQMAAQVRTEVGKWGKVVKTAGVKIE